MILTVDIGNTNIKVGAWDKDTLVFVSRLQTNQLRTSEEYAIALLDLFLLNACNSSQFDGAILSSVVPPLSRPLLHAVRTVIQSPRIYVVSPGLKTGLNIKIDDPASLGGDIVCAGVAAIEKYPLPCIVLSLGTATTLFVIDKDGACIGGTVAPGVSISLEALSQRAAQLPYISLQEPARVIGTNTVDSMRAGIVYGTAGMLDGLIERIQEEIGDDNTSVVACGGVAADIIPHCKCPIQLDDNLVLEGLKLIYYKNIKQ